MKFSVPKKVLLPQGHLQGLWATHSTHWLSITPRRIPAPQDAAGGYAARAARLGHPAALYGAQHGGLQLRAEVGQRGVAVQACAVRKAARPRKDGRHCTRTQALRDRVWHLCGLQACVPAPRRHSAHMRSQQRRPILGDVRRPGALQAVALSCRTLQTLITVGHAPKKSVVSNWDGAPGLVDVGRPFWCSRQCRVTVPACTRPGS